MIILLGLMGIIAGAVSGVIGAGSSMILLPVIATMYSPQTAISIMAIAAIMGNVSRLVVWYKEIQLKPFLLYTIPAIPAAIIGTNTLLSISVLTAEVGMGIFFLIMIPIRRKIKSLPKTVNHLYLVLSGVVVGYLTGLMFSTGPLSIAMFSSYGLSKGMLLSTESAASFLIYLTKATTFSMLDALPVTVLLSGFMVGCTVVIGTYLSKHLVLRMPDAIHSMLMDGVSLAAGSMMLIHAALLYFNA